MIDLPPSPDGAGVLIVMNKGAGTAVIRLDPRPTIAERLPAATVRELEPDEGMADVVRDIMTGEDPPRVLSVYGGDGSVSRMAQLALEFDVPFMPLPGGTFNHFSRTAGIETVDLAIDALQAGSGIAASVGELTAGGRVDDRPQRGIHRHLPRIRRRAHEAQGAPRQVDRRESSPRGGGCGMPSRSTS